MIINRNGHKSACVCINMFVDGFLLFAGNVRESAEVRFGIGSIDKIIRESKTLYEECLNDNA